MPIYLIVGQPRHGKSQFAVSLAHAIHENNLKFQKKLDDGHDEYKDSIREIYSDIEGHSENTNYVSKAPVDWRDVPNNSIIFMDEIHKRPEYCDDGKMSNNPMIVDLTTHGHQNKDIYLITQDPQRLNKGIRALVEKMYLVKRPIQKPNFATIYEFERWLRDPWQAAVSERSVKYQDSYKFFYKKKWQDMYTSASAHTSIQFKLQKKFVFAIIAIIALFSLSYFLFMKSGGDKLARNAIGGLTGEQPAQTEQKPAVVPVSVADAPLTNLDIECRKGVNIERPECVQWFNTMSNGTIDPDGRIQTVSYNPNDPYGFEYVPQVTPTDFPRMSGVIQLSSGRLMAIDQQGNYMPGVSQADCKKYLSGHRPFDYFRKEKPPEKVQAVEVTEEQRLNARIMQLQLENLEREQQSQRSVGESGIQNLETSSL